MKKLVNGGHLFPSVCHTSADLIKKKLSATMIHPVLPINIM